MTVILLHVVACAYISVYHESAIYSLGKVLPRSEKCCDKKKLDTGSFTCCRNEVKEEQVLKSKPHHNECCFLKNGSTKTYNSNENGCSLSLGAVVSNTPRCGVHTYNTTKDICCSGIFIENGHLLNLDCCGIKEYHKRNETCDDGIIKNKTRYVTLLRCIDGSRMGTERPLWTFVFIYKNSLATFHLRKSGSASAIFFFIIAL